MLLGVSEARLSAPRALGVLSIVRSSIPEVATFSLQYIFAIEVSCCFYNILYQKRAVLSKRNTVTGVGVHTTHLRMWTER